MKLSRCLVTDKINKTAAVPATKASRYLIWKDIFVTETEKICFGKIASDPYLKPFQSKDERSWNQLIETN